MMLKSAAKTLTSKTKIKKRTNRLWRDQSGVNPIIDPKAKPRAMFLGFLLDWRGFSNFKIKFRPNKFNSSQLRLNTKNTILLHGSIPFYELLSCKNKRTNKNQSIYPPSRTRFSSYNSKPNKWFYATGVTSCSFRYRTITRKI